LFLSKKILSKKNKKTKSCTLSKKLLQTEERGSRMPVGALATQLSNNEQNHTATLASFDLEILNFQNLTRSFGFKHSAYDTGSKRDFMKGIDPGEPPVRIENVLETEYQYKYNGKELQDELGLNWDSFKWRNYDYAIGRFMSVDPLAEQYCKSPKNSDSLKYYKKNEFEIYCILFFIMSISTIESF